MPADTRGGWKWLDENGKERLRFMWATGENPGNNKWSRQTNGYSSGTMPMGTF